MNATVISYSMTGNNDTLATSLSRELAAKHIRITESKERTNGLIALDILFNRTPEINESMKDVDTDGGIIFLAPIWMGKIASPMRGAFKQLKPRIKRYSFITLSGGSDGPNKKIGKDLGGRPGKEPEKIVEFLIADLLPKDPKPSRENTSNYRLSDKDLNKLKEGIFRELDL